MAEPNINDKPQHKRTRIALPFWEGAGELLKIGTLCDSWWDKVQGWLEKVPLHVNAETAPLVLVDLLAWQRDINRLPAEPEELYRLRVKYALANAKDAGSKIGFENIWERLQLGYIGQNERFDLTDWDVIQLEVSESTISQNSALLDEIIRMYGRTCRRYTWVTVQDLPQGLRSFDFDLIRMDSVAREEEPQAGAQQRSFVFDNDNELLVASL